MIIDFHTHTFPEKIALRTLDHLAGKSQSRYYTDGTTESLAVSMKKAGIDYSVNLPVMTAPQQADRVNDSLLRAMPALEEKGILTFGGMHPEYENIRGKLKELKEGGVKGIKLHPAYQETDIDDPKMLRIIEAASDLDLIIITHAGLDIGIPGHNYADTGMLLHVIDTLRPPKFVLAHMGGWDGWDDVEKYIAGAPVWLDTAFSVGEIDPFREGDRPLRSLNLNEEDFVRLCRKHGTDRILFATDSPWADQSDYVQRFMNMSFSADERSAILGGNAYKLMNMREEGKTDACN